MTETERKLQQAFVANLKESQLLKQRRFYNERIGICRPNFAAKYEYLVELIDNRLGNQGETNG